MAVRRRQLPANFNDYPLIRSYAHEGHHSLYRVEVRRDPVSGHTVQATFPIWPEASTSALDILSR